MDIEGKGFVIKDKRSLDEKGDLKEKRPEEEIKENEQEAQKVGQDRTPLPEINFNSFILSISSSALLHLGEIPDPHTGEKKKDVALAKHSIDIIAMLKEKTKGNLDQEEQRLIDNILTDLRWRYVKAKD